MGVTEKGRRAIAKLLQKVPNSVTIRAYTMSWDDDDDPVYSNYADTSDTAIVQIMSLDDNQVQMGILEVGDATIFFDHNATVSPSSTTKYDIIFNSIKYEVKMVVVEYGEDGGLIFQECHCKKRNLTT